MPSLRLMSLEGALRAFCDAVEEQIHLDQRGRRTTAASPRNFADDPDIDFPRLVPDACSDAVLTMEFVDGVREEDLEARGVDVRRVVDAGMRCVCRMIFLHGFVHADLHPGNVRFLAPGRVVLLDLGLVGQPRRRRPPRRSPSCCTRSRPATASPSRASSTTARRTQRSPDYAAYEREIVAFVDNVRARGLGNLQVTLEIGRIFDILRRHRIQARSHMTMVNLALMTAEGLGKRLAPELSLTDAALPYLAEALAAAPPPA